MRCGGPWIGSGPTDMPRIAIVAALDREIAPLVKGWHATEREHDGRRFRFFEGENAVAVAGGMGAEPARRATEAVIALYTPEIVYSVGFAGALDPNLKVGDIVVPQRVLDARDCSSVDTGAGHGTLISFGSVVTPEQKKKLADWFSACAVDMEAAFVARAADARRIKFAAVKSISDDSRFALPANEAFISHDGDFRAGRFAAFVMVRPWLWKSVVHLARNSSHASRTLCDRLSVLIKGGCPIQA